MVHKVKVSPDRICGDVDSGYGRIADAFRRNMASGREIGAAVAVYRDGIKVVDLWGGYRNGLTRRPWEADTLINVFSTTKGLTALAVAVAESRGLLSYEAKVADYWPEFGQASKQRITVRQLLSHQAGLCSLDTALSPEGLADQAMVSTILAAQHPAWAPGTRQGYHAITLGWYASELIRRVDPAGRSVGRFFHDEIAAPLAMDFYIGLPASVDRSRVARLHGWRRAEMLLHLHELPPRFVISMLNSRSLAARAFGVLDGRGGMECYNDEEMRRVEIPAANGTGTPRSVAHAYGCVATGGTDLGLGTQTFNALTQPAHPPSDGISDKVLQTNTAFSLGFFKPFPRFTFGSSSRAFGTPGAGGSFGFADPDTGIGFAYAPNRLGFHLWSDPRELALRQALFADILKSRRQT